MLHEFRKKVTCLDPAVSKRITLIAGAAAGFEVGRTFPVALMSGSFDHLLGDKDRSEAFVNVARHLDSRGTFVFDIGLGYMNDSPLKPAGEQTVGEKTYRRFVGRSVLPDRIVEYRLVYEMTAGKEVIERIEQRSFAGIVDRALVHRLLGSAGFSISREFGGYDLTPYDDGDDILIVEAQKL
jgi:hypothetical protein